MRKSYERLASFFRWIVVSMVAVVIALPTYVSLSVEI